MQAESRTVEQHKRKFSTFLEFDEFQEKFDEKIKQAINSKKFRFIVDINELRSFEGDLANKIIKKPREYIVALQEAGVERSKKIDPSFEKVLKSADLQVGFEGSFGANAVSPRGLNSSMLNSLVQVEGIITKCSSVRPKLMRSVQYCPATKLWSIRDYRDATSIDIGIEVTGGSGERLPTSSNLPSMDADGNPLEIEHGLCMYKDYQTLVLQEMPEKARVGQLPRSVDVILEHDLVDRAKPGDRIVCVGVYRSLPSTQGGSASNAFKTVLMCNNISIIGKEIGAVRLTGTDVKNIRELSLRPDVLETMSRALCPSIFGHEFIKKALILQLLGGCERVLENGTHLRGDINVMFVGDPSTAKSQLLRAVLDIAPLAISTTGRGSTGVGLTAAVTTDPETGDRRLEAGAMVLADRGVVCIDEFDKMGENDRVAIHEVMEQQTVTIAKAGIHASLNARSSVLAAANPIYGQYDKTRRPQENIGLPDSLLSRFDLLFIVLDQLDSGLDRTLSEHVIRSHQHRRAGTLMEPEPLNVTTSLNLDETQDASVAVDTAMWQRGSRVFADGAGNKTNQGDLLTKEFLRKYIHYAKSRIHPVLSDAAMATISTSYANMRARQSRKNLPVTARTLETIIRLSSASAKCRLSNSVDECDVEVAMELMNFVLFHEIGSDVHTPVVDTPSSLHSAHANSGTSKAGASVNSSAENKENQTNSVYDLPEEAEEEEEDLGINDEQYRNVYVDDSTPRYVELQRVLDKFMTSGEDVIPLEALLRRLNGPTSGSKRADAFRRKEAVCILYELERQNKVMYNEGTIHIV